MSYPGHLRSLHLSGQRISNSDQTDGDDFRQPDLSRKRRYTGSSSNGRDAGSLDSKSSIYFSPGEILDAVCDDRGNEARPSLWIGNVSRGVSETEVRAIFGLGDPQGKIQSLRIQNSGRESYIFVNYWDIEDATQALRKYHERDVFERDRPVYIRFAKSQEEAVKEKIATSRTTSKSETRKIEGLPPTGPRAMRRSISPPALRRSGSSYRPTEHITKEKSARSLKRKRAREQAMYENCYRPTYRDDDNYEHRSLRQDSRRSSDARHEYDTLRAGKYTTSERSQSQQSGRLENPSTDKLHYQSRIEKEAVKEFDQKADREADLLLQPTNVEHDHVDLDGMCFPLEATTGQAINHSECVDLDGMQITAEISANHDSTSWEDSNRKMNSTGKQPFDHLVRLFETQGRLELSRPLSQASKPFPDSVTTAGERKAPNPFLNAPLDRIRHTTEETESTTVSKQSLSRKKNCAKCKKPETALSALSLRCSNCPRKFHSACVNLSSSNTGGQSFICSRCLHKGKVESTCSEAVVPSISVETTSAHNLEKNADEDNPSEIDVHHNEPLTTAQNPSRMSSQTHHVDGSSNSSQNEMNGLKPSPKLNQIPSSKNKIQDLENHIAPIPPSAPKTMIDNKLHADAKCMIEKYKRLVTCTHWEKSLCWRSDEKDCMFAHTYTDIGSPRCPRSYKSWTCYYWKSQGSCNDRCRIHAHHDTGLYVGFDGWASKKHLTCPFYYNKGYCKKSEEECPYAHQDTGFLAPEPKGYISKPTGEPKQSLPSDIVIQNTLRAQQPERITTNLPIYQQLDGSTTNDLNSPFSGLESDSSYSPTETTEVLLPAFLFAGSNHDVMSRFQEITTVNGTEVFAGEAHSPNSSTVLPLQPTESDDNTCKQVTQDPRKSKMSTIDPQATQVSSNETPTNETIAQASRLDNTGIAKSESVINRHFSMRECKSCGKKVLNTDICVSCKETRPPAAASSLVKTNGLHPSERKDREDESQETRVNEPNDTQLDSLVVGEFGGPVPKDISSIKVLKRSASGSNMFLPNKRARPSLTTAQTGPVTEVRLHGTKLITDQPSIEALIEQAKVSKAMESILAPKNDETEKTCSPTEKADTPIMPSPIKNSAYKESTHLTDCSPIFASPQTTKTNEHTTVDLFSQPLPSIEPLVFPTEQESSGVSGQYNQSICSTPLVDPDSEIQKWIGHPVRSSPTSRPRMRSRSGSTSISGDSDVPLAMLDARKVQRTEEALPSRPNSRGPMPVSKEPCTCGQRRRKCLHFSKYQTQLDPKKCHDWIMAERARGSEFKGRSRLEMESIEDAASRYVDNMPDPDGPQHDERQVISEPIRVNSEEPIPRETDFLRSKEVLNGPNTSESTDSMEGVSYKSRSTTPTDEETAATSHSSPHTANDILKIKEDPLLVVLKQRGVEFESSDEDREEEIPSFLSNHVQRKEFPRSALTKSQGLKSRHRLCEQQMNRNQQIYGNPHHEVDHLNQKHVIRAKVQYTIRHRNIDSDQFLPDSIVVKDEDITFQEFLGVPEHLLIEPCLFGQGATETLAFREKDKDQEYSGFEFAGYRNKRRVNDVQKWPLTER